MRGEMSDLGNCGDVCMTRLTRRDFHLSLSHACGVPAADGGEPFCRALHDISPHCGESPSSEGAIRGLRNDTENSLSHALRRASSL